MKKFFVLSLILLALPGCLNILGARESVTITGHGRWAPVARWVDDATEEARRKASLCRLALKQGSRPVYLSEDHRHVDVLRRETREYSARGRRPYRRVVVNEDRFVDDRRAECEFEPVD